MISAIDEELRHRRADLRHDGGLIDGAEDAFGDNDALNRIEAGLTDLDGRDRFGFLFLLFRAAAQ